MKNWLPLLLSLLLLGCLKEDDLKKEYVGFQPTEIGDGWKLGSSAQNKVDSLALNGVYRSVYENEDTWPLRSLLVFRNGELIAESYFKNESDRSKPQAIWACTKQVMAVLTGILFDENKIFMTDRIGQFLDKYLADNRDKKDILIKDLLTMRSGIGFHNEEHTDVFRKKETSSSVDFVLDLEMEAKSGSRFNYNDGDAQLMSAVIQEITYLNTDEFARDKLFDKIGLKNYEWRRYPDGITLGGFGILTTPREIAKVGQLVLNKGLWDSTQIVSEKWLDEMLSEQSKVPDYGQLSFGYYWWLNPSKNYQFMWGDGGQYVFLIPDKNAMVVMTSLEQVDSKHAVWIEDATRIVDMINKTMN